MANQGNTDLNEVRENFKKLATNHFKHQTKQKMKELMNLKFDIWPEELDLPALEGTEVLSDQEIKQFEVQLRKYIKLIEILERKNRCPISRIIDNI